MDVFILNLLPCCHILLPYITGFDIKVNHHIFTHTPCCHHCHYCQYFNVDIILFHNGTCYIDPLLSRIHVETTYLLNIMCTLVATTM